MRSTRHFVCVPSAEAQAIRPDEIVGFSGVGVALPDGRPLLQDVNFSVYRGDFALIKGSSGAGKSTVHRTAAMLETPVTGQVRLFGKDVHTYDAYESRSFDWLRRLVGQDSRSQQERHVARMFRRRIGLGFQRSNLKGGWNVFDNMIHHAEMTGLADDTTYYRAADILYQFGLADKAEQAASTLSGGEQQKVALGSLLLTRPELLLLDEPTEAMDVPAKLATFQLLQRLAFEQGTTIMMVSHNEQATDYVNRQIHIEGGRIVADDRMAAPMIAPPRQP